MNNIIELLDTPPDEKQLARELMNAGYYGYGDALRTVAYWVKEGKTLAEIRKSYHLGGE